MPLALVTGATAGLGAEFATQLAERGYDLVAVARNTERLAATKAQLTAVSVEVLSADLSTADGCAAVIARLAAGDVDLLVNNAGIATYRPFGELGLAAEEAQLDLNVRAVLRLSHAAVRAMTEHGSGRILNVSSVAGFVPRGGNATYSASKAWVTLFSEALAVQLAGTAVTVTAVCPGFVRTEFHARARADMSHVPSFMWLSARDVVGQALDDAFAGKPLSIPARRYRAMITAARILPRPALRAIMRRGGF